MIRKTILLMLTGFDKQNVSRNREKQYILKLYTIIIVFLIVSCMSKSKSELIQGNWKLISVIDLKTMKTFNGNDTMNTFNRNDTLYALISKDSIILRKEKEKDEAFSWSIKEDTITIIQNKKKYMVVCLKTLNEKTMEIDFDFFGPTRYVFERTANSNQYNKQP